MSRIRGLAFLALSLLAIVVIGRTALGSYDFPFAGPWFSSDLFPAIGSRCDPYRSI